MQIINLLNEAQNWCLMFTWDLPHRNLSLSDILAFRREKTNPLRAGPVYFPRLFHGSFCMEVDDR